MLKYAHFLSTGTNTCSGSVGAIAGAILGASFWNWHSDMLRVRARKPAPLRVVITGSSRGIGKALAREFLRAGDRVVVTSRSLADAQAAAAALVGEGVGGAPRSVIGLACDVGDAGSVEALAGAAMHQLGGVDVWINNAGTSGGFQVRRFFRVVRGVVDPVSHFRIREGHVRFGVHAAVPGLAEGDGCHEQAHARPAVESPPPLIIPP